jgi:hypothetical protein
MNKLTDREERSALVKNLVERRYGPFPGAGGAGRILFESALKDQPIEVLRSMVKYAEIEAQKKRERKFP